MSPPAPQYSPPPQQPGYIVVESAPSNEYITDYQKWLEDSTSSAPSESIVAQDQKGDTDLAPAIRVDANSLGGIAAANAKDDVVETPIPKRKVVSNVAVVKVGSNAIAEFENNKQARLDNLKNDLRPAIGMFPSQLIVGDLARPPEIRPGHGENKEGTFTVELSVSKDNYPIFVNQIAAALEKNGYLATSFNETKDIQILDMVWEGHILWDGRGVMDDAERGEGMVNLILIESLDLFEANNGTGKAAITGKAFMLPMELAEWFKFPRYRTTLTLVDGAGNAAHSGRLIVNNRILSDESLSDEGQFYFEDYGKKVIIAPFILDNVTYYNFLLGSRIAQTKRTIIPSATDIVIAAELK